MVGRSLKLPWFTCRNPRWLQSFFVHLNQLDINIMRFSSYDEVKPGQFTNFGAWFVIWVLFYIWSLGSWSFSLLFLTFVPRYLHILFVFMIEYTSSGTIRFSYSWFHKQGTFSVHSFNDDYLSIPERPGM